MMKILLAEDNPVNQMITRKIVEKLGTEVDIANNGREAVSMAQKEKYDFILMDVNMPLMNGLDAAMAIRGLGFEMPIIALTADAEEITDQLQQCGINDFIPKPVNIAKIEEIIQNLRKEMEYDTVGASYIFVSSQLGLESETITELLGEFVKDSIQHAGYLLNAINERDPVRTASEAHYIKGAAKNMGLPGIAAAAEKIEKGARNNEQKDYVALQSDLAERLRLFSNEVNGAS